MDSNIPANPAYGVYISQLVRYARICTSKVDFINRLRGLSLRLRQQGFETNRLQNSFNKFVNRHGLIVEKYGVRIFISVVYWYVCARNLILGACIIYLFKLRVHLVRLITS